MNIVKVGDAYKLGSDEVRFVSPKRVRRSQPEATFSIHPAQKRTRGAQLVQPPSHSVPVHVPNRPARFPPLWPEEMTAETAAAFMNFATTRQLCQAIARGEAAPPTSYRHSGGRIECLWHIIEIRKFAAQRHGSG
ncbi:MULTISPECIES: hypothetical protein [unclassified Bradyrhizobium]|uniref:hypothetical protein n=1 Tax=unclassified Bradyrhizobium TaxID=2631580 RepID=UPI00247A176F|nr:MULTISPECIES: hypothetical protein [unclassified Bradyrhizobium]WGR70431.1 hypothetical protein MTX24_34490 [Bradyrhizobium sp. ISRA426]WGR82487.1 hypothetical protein MTX21_19590 [Bradyrhizobium sp. ISRA430]WGR85673.1 hypothetical protein MTX25_34170 [Bradyrhizobium sp. ISRA432]